MEDERLVLIDLDELRELLEVLLHVDMAHRVVAEHAEPPVEAQVDRRGLEPGRVERVDDDPARVEVFADGAVGEDHFASVT